MRTGLLLVAAITAACSSSPTSPSGQTDNFTWTVNGQPFSASSNGMAALSVNGRLSLAGVNCSAGAGLGINVPSTAAGTYNVGTGGVSITWTPDGRSGSAANEAWSAPAIPRVVGNTIVAGGSGSLTITSSSADAVSGNFSAEVIADPSNRDTAAKTVSGSFSLRIRDRSVC